MPSFALPSLPQQVAPPEFVAVDRPLTGAGPRIVAVPVEPATDDEGVALGPGAAAVVEETGVDLLGLLEHHEATGKAGEIVRHPVLDHPDLDEVVCVGIGAGGTDDFRVAGAQLARALKDRDAVATSIPSLTDEAGLRAFVVGMMLASFEFHMRSDGPKTQPVRRVVLAGPAAADGAQDAVIAAAVAVGTAAWQARALATTPANVKNPQWLVEVAEGIAEGAGLKLHVWDADRLEAEGFGGIIAVGRASATPPRLIQLDYTPGKTRGVPHVVLVGKGITFDSGGLSIKPGEAMVNMKRDMTGGAVVLATMAALGEIGCPVRVTGLVAAAENAIGGASYRPGDVIRHYGGRTTEVTNTDAEGRLVLADALAYAAAQLKPDVLVDVATLTGAIKVALGLATAGFFATDEALAGQIERAGAAAGERFWRFPLAEEYEEKLSSKIADADNGAGNPGAITAALFLQHFTGNVPWAHLDIASVGDAPAEQNELTTGPTGFGVRTLLHWLEQPEPTKGLSRKGARE